MKGDITRAKNLGSIKPDESMHPGDGDGSQCCSAEQLGEKWTSLQFSEAKSVIWRFLMRKYSKCQNCGSINPKISEPTFGWFHVVNFFSSIVNTYGLYFYFFGDHCSILLHHMVIRRIIFFL